MNLKLDQGIDIFDFFELFCIFYIGISNFMCANQQVHVVVLNFKIADFTKKVLYKPPNTKLAENLILVLV